MVRIRRDKPEDPTNRYVRMRIREARHERNMSQEELAQFLYKTRAAVSDIERGRVLVSAYDLMLIAAALEKPIDYFFPPRFRGAQEENLAPDEKELVYLYRQMDSNPAMKKFAIQQIRRMADTVIQTDLAEITSID